jgi:hypothetical protein
MVTGSILPQGRNAMPVTADLIENGRIICLRTASPWNVDETFEAYKVAEGYFDAATHKLHSLVDVRDLVSIPPGVLKVRNTPFISHKNSGNMAVVGAQKLARTLAETMLKLTSFKRARFFETYEEAIDYLKQIITNEVTG